jgi:hypothetical protein
MARYVASHVRAVGWNGRRAGDGALRRLPRPSSQELLALETDPEAKIADYKEMFSRFPDQSPGSQLVLDGEGV